MVRRGHSPLEVKPSSDKSERPFSPQKSEASPLLDAMVSILPCNWR